MKKSILSLIIIAAIFAGCKKEETLRQPEAKQISNTEQRILNFEQKLHSAQKDGITYAIDSAEWYVEALLNYNTVTEGIECAGITVDTALTSLPIPATGEYTLTQLESVYSQLLSQVQQNLPEGTIVFAVDLHHYQVETVMVFSTSTAYATPTSPQFKSLNDTSGYWFWGNNLGMCGPDSGQYIGMDASDVLENQIGSSTTGVWTNIEVFTVLPSYFPDPNFPFDIPYLEPTRLFSAAGPFNEVLYYCIPPNVMNYYLSNQGIYSIIHDLKPDRKSFIYCDLTPAPIDYLSVNHLGGFWFGVPLH